MDAIVVVHRGEADYLEYALRQLAKRSASRIVLVGDQTSSRFDFVERRSIDAPELATDLDEFRSIYRHWSDLRPDAERFCIERWFYVRNLTRAERWNSCLAIDSDVLFFCDVDEEARRFSEYAMTFARWDDARNLVHCNFISKRAALESFCEFVLDVYRTPEKLEAIKSVNRKKADSYWVSDMSLFNAWAKQSAEKFAFFEDFYRDGVCFDDKITKTGAFQGVSYLPLLTRKYKRILYFKDGVPYGRLKDGRVVPFRCIHYHSYSKLLMKDHFEGRHSNWRAFVLLLTRRFSRLPRKFRRNWEKYGGKLAAAFRGRSDKRRSS